MASKLTLTEAEELQKQGQDLFRQKKYQAALQRFNAVLQQDRKPSLTALDCRAATRTKLADLQAALRDGRRMIQEYKTSCSGYLRTGQVLQLLHKDDVAAGIYGYGLRSVPASDPNRELIQAMYDKLIKKRAPAVVRDPLLSLPIEVTEMILEYLSFRNIVTCSRVSQNWRSLICSLPRLWIHLDLAGATRPVSVGTVTNYIKRSRKRITRATLQGWAAQSAILKCIATRCNALAHLEILGGFTSTLLVEVAPALQSLKVLRIAADTSLDAVSQLLSLCKSLEHAHFLSVTAKHSIKWTGDLSKLLTLSIDAKMKDPDKRSILLQLRSLIPMIGNIRHLCFQRWSGSSYSTAPAVDFSTLTKLQNLNLAYFDAADFPLLPSSIQTLDIPYWYDCAFASDVSQAHISEAKLKNLTSFSVGAPSDLSITDLCMILDPNKGNLTSLNISNSTALDSEEVITLVESGYLENIVELTMMALRIDDGVAIILANRLHKLRSLNLGLTGITGVGVKSLVLKNGCKLERLGLNHCHRVGIDAVEWARTHGVDVSFTFPEYAIGKSRRVQAF